MQPDAISTRPLIAWGAAGRTLPEQSVSGDLYLVKPFTGGVLLAVVDGLGHGEEAATAANTAIAILERHSGEPLNGLVIRCHEALMRMRGAVMTLATLRAFG